MSVSDSLRELPASVFQNVFCVSRPSVLARSGDCVRFWVAGFASADMPPYKRRFLIRFSHTTLCRCVVFPPACDEGLLWNSCPFVFSFASFLCINVLLISSAGWCLMLVISMDCWVSVCLCNRYKAKCGRTRDKFGS